MNTNGAKVAFRMKTVRVKLENILPLRQIKEPHNLRRYRMILASIKAAGMIEPLVVYPKKGLPGKYVLLDGHMRLCAIRGLGQEEAECLEATDDECFTYNARVNRLNPISEHRMIMKAVKSGVPPGKIAAVLNMELRDVKSSMSLLEGIHAEAVEMLKDRPVSPKAIRLLRKVSGVRQIEIAELMISANNYTKGYAEALVLGTPKSELANPEEPKLKEGMTREDIAKLEVEMESVEKDLKAVEQAYGENMLTLTVAKSYIKRMLENGKVVRFLTGNYREIFAEFEALAGAEGV